MVSKVGKQRTYGEETKKTVERNSFDDLSSNNMAVSASRYAKFTRELGVNIFNNFDPYFVVSSLAAAQNLLI